MSAPVKLATFAAVLAVVFAGAAVAGQAIDPDRAEPQAAEGHGGSEPAGGHAEPAGAEGAGEHAGAHPVRGLAVAENGMRLVVATPELRRGRTETLRFRIAGEDGRTLRDFDVEHTKRMHLIVARRDLSGFQHLHPEQAEDGSWSAPVRLGEAGSYRVFADFSRGDEPTTLAADLRVDGAARLAPLPAPATTATTDGGLQVRLDAGTVRAGRPATLRFTVTDGGRTVHTEPYLGAGGHLVALREGDLAFLHVHPTEAGHDDGAAEDEHDDAVGFEATFPTEGRYRLFLQVKVDGRVHTVAFTQAVRS